MASNESTGQDNFSGSAVGSVVVRRCQEGDPDAQRQLYETCHRPIYRLMTRMVGVQDAADVTQQVFLQAYRRIHQFEGQAKFETWLYKLATNEALQHLRKGRRWRFERLAVDPVNDETTEQVRDEQREILDQALSRLDAALRMIFVLREVNRMSYREIAEVTELPEGTVGSRLNRARRELQQHLANLGWEE